jgi:hypothetical protein
LFHSGAIRPLSLPLGWAFALLVGASVAAAADRVYPTAEAVEPLAAGSSVPSVTVSTVGGAPVDLSKVVRDRGALLVFYRGGW